MIDYTCHSGDEARVAPEKPDILTGPPCHSESGQQQQEVVMPGPKPQHDYTKAIDRYGQGWSLKAIGIQYGVCKQTIANALERVGVKRRSTAEKLRKEPKIVNGIEHWLCAACGEWFPRENFCLDRRYYNSLSSRCKGCISDRNRKYQAEHKILLHTCSKEQAQKVQARNRLNSAVRYGKLTKPTKCSECGCHCKPHAYH